MFVAVYTVDGRYSGYQFLQVAKLRLFLHGIKHSRYWT